MTAALLDRAEPAINRSATPAIAPSNRPSAGPGRQPSHLRVLDQSAARRRARLRAALGFLFFAVLAGFFGVAFVHAQLVAGQQHLDDVRTQIRDLEADRAELIQSVEQASAPHVIVNRAKTELGMVSPETPVYLAAVDAPEVVFPNVVSDELPLVDEPAPNPSVNVVASAEELVNVQVSLGQRGGISGRADSDITGLQVAAGQASEVSANSASDTSLPSISSLAGLQVDAAPEQVSAAGGQG